MPRSGHTSTEKKELKMFGDRVTLDSCEFQENVSYFHLIILEGEC